MKVDANGYRKFGIRDSVAYAAGDLGCNISFTKEELLKMNKQLNRIRKPKK